MPFRRRPLRPGSHPRRPRRRKPVPPVVRRALAQAQRVAAAGDWQAAAKIYDRLAEQAYQRGLMRPGSQMDMEAARALLRAEAYTPAQEHALRALRSLLQVGGAPRQVRPLVDRVCQALEAKNARAEAQSFRQAVDAVLHEHGFSLDALPQPDVQHQGTLPAQCPSCQAPLRPDEVEWLAPDRAQCSYCNNVILTQ